MSSGGVPGVRVTMVDEADLCNPHVEWNGISRQNYFKFTDGKITAWEAYGVGIGRVMQQGKTWG